VSKKADPLDFYPKHLNHAFITKPDFEGYRANAKKEFEANQDYLDKELHQEPDHASTFMNMIKRRTRAMPVVNDKRRQVLPSRVIWDGTIDRFEVFRNNVEGHYGQIGAGYLFDLSFQEAYLEKEVNRYIDSLDELPYASQIKYDARALYGTLLSACQSGVGRRILMENRRTQDGIRSWYQLVKQYDSHNNKKLGSRSWKMSSLQYFIVTTRVYCLNVSQTMKMLSRNLFYLARRLGMMMR
jgi:hypothetical protein